MTISDGNTGHSRKATFLQFHWRGLLFSEMAVHIKRNANINLSEGVSNSAVHFVPCNIQYDGEANVSKYFEPYVKKNKDRNVLISSFRGYPLMGEVINLPKNYKGIVIQETVKPMTEGTERNIHVTHTFNSLTYWNWDKPPSQNDVFLSALDWIDVSEVLHSPVENSNE